MEELFQAGEQCWLLGKETDATLLDINFAITQCANFTVPDLVYYCTG